VWLSTYDIRPSKLFDGVDQRLLIYITAQKTKGCYTSAYHRWYEEERSFLFETLEYVSCEKTIIPHSIAKIHKKIELEIIHKLLKNTPLFENIGGQNFFIYYHNAPRYFIHALKEPPYFWNEKNREKSSLNIQALSCKTDSGAKILGAVLNSSLFYWWFILFSNSRHVGSSEIDYFPLSLHAIDTARGKKLGTLFEKLTADYNTYKHRKETTYKTAGRVVYDEFYPKLSKPIIDEIDTVLAEHYALTAEELDFIINFDIKYRMGMCPL
jgi:hypothetical protein